jgi:hypothetical protein
MLAGDRFPCSLSYPDDVPERIVSRKGRILLERLACAEVCLQLLLFLRRELFDCIEDLLIGEFNLWHCSSPYIFLPIGVHSSLWLLSSC